ncbi:MAG: DNA-packaging protein [Gammaproteobacteria bacterium]|nr:DNA-packaging protein [Gammaproteobacteria bacterium]
MLFGGSRSGKTFLMVRQIITRALKAKGSRHAAFRFRFNHAKTSLVQDTIPKVLDLCWPGLRARTKLDKTDWYLQFPNDSILYIGGLDDKERTEKILGNEFATIYLNECSQIPWSARKMAVTRLAQDVGLKLKMYYDCNPPNQAHWTYQLFQKKLDPESRSGLLHPGNFVSMQINPLHNVENLPDAYMQELEGLPERDRKRFLSGEFIPANENSLWSSITIDKNRILDGDKLPDYQRIVVAVDPSGADDENPDHDAIGIVIAALGTDGVAYVLEDLTLQAGPATWGNVATSAFDRHAADIIVGEDNFGGAMVHHVIKTSRKNTPYKAVKASRGKVVRAEPISALYEQGKVKHVGYFPELEDELMSFTTTGYQGIGSPNRGDALVWAITELFPGLTRAEAKEIDTKAGLTMPMQTNDGWMAA